tara:strand:+ start:659 stop:865 length:207 start_codon:yes stop_codon:yes gene_type:complete
MSKKIPAIENIPSPWKDFAEEAGIEALLTLARVCGNHDSSIYIPTLSYLLSDCEKVRSSKERIANSRQ